MEACFNKKTVVLVLIKLLLLQYIFIYCIEYRRNKFRMLKFVINSVSEEDVPTMLHTIYAPPKELMLHSCGQLSKPGMNEHAICRFGVHLTDNFQCNKA